MEQTTLKQLILGHLDVLKRQVDAEVKPKMTNTADLLLSRIGLIQHYAKDIKEPVIRQDEEMA